MYGQLDAYKHSGSTLDRSTLLDLYNGGSWARNFKNKLGPSKMLKTALNMSGFIQPAFVVSMLDKCDADGFNDCQLFDCPEEVEYKYKDLKVPMDESIPSLSLVFKVLREVHQKKRIITSYYQPLYPAEVPLDATRASCCYRYRCFRCSSEQLSS